MPGLSSKLTLGLLQGCTQSVDVGLAVCKELQDLTVVVNGLVEPVMVALHNLIYEPFNRISLSSQLRAARRIRCDQTLDNLTLTTDSYLLQCCFSIYSAQDIENMSERVKTGVLQFGRDLVKLVVDRVPVHSLSSRVSPQRERWRVHSFGRVTQG